MRFAPKSAAALSLALRASRWRFNQVFCAEIKPLEQFYLQQLMTTEDANEGLAAFLEKRKPQWTNG
jgi:cyclohexa-1,5-dienecarbonyl-CoA hydratase